MNGLLFAGLWMLALLAAAHAKADCWRPLPQGSSVQFEVKQAGASLDGAFSNYDGTVCLGMKGDTGGAVDVQLDLASVDAGSSELNDALKGPDFFDIRRWPRASFKGSNVHALGSHRYSVSGTLTIRGASREISVPFSFRQAGDGKATATGTLAIDRLDYGIGTGQWANTHWLANRVEIHFLVKLVRAAAPPAPQ